MKEILLVRHAKSSWDYPDLRDFDRPLNNRGRKNLPLMAEILHKIGWKPDLTLASPALRSRLTTLSFCASWRYHEQKIIWDGEIYSSSVSYMLSLLRGLPQTCERAAFFGHNPEFTELVNFLNPVFIENLPTCGAVLLSVNAEKWEQIEKNNAKIQFFVYPKLFDEEGNVKEEKKNYIYLPKILK
jgi:phosphohistidine phosphatase